MLETVFVGEGIIEAAGGMALKPSEREIMALLLDPIAASSIIAQPKLCSIPHFLPRIYALICARALQCVSPLYNLIAARIL